MVAGFLNENKCILEKNLSYFYTYIFSIFPVAFKMELQRDRSLKNLVEDNLSHQPSKISTNEQLR